MPRPLYRIKAQHNVLAAVAGQSSRQDAPRQQQALDQGTGKGNRQHVSRRQQAREREVISITWYFYGLFMDRMHTRSLNGIKKMYPMNRVQQTVSKFRTCIIKSLLTKGGIGYCMESGLRVRAYLA